jgi:hypothetical protein
VLELAKTVRASDRSATAIGKIFNKVKKRYIIMFIFPFIPWFYGVRDTVVVDALCYKPEGRGFETR